MMGGEYDSMKVNNLLIPTGKTNQHQVVEVATFRDENMELNGQLN